MLERLYSQSGNFYYFQNNKIFIDDTHGTNKRNRMQKSYFFVAYKFKHFNSCRIQLQYHLFKLFNIYIIDPILLSAIMVIVMDNAAVAAPQARHKTSYSSSYHKTLLIFAYIYIPIALARPRIKDTQIESFN